MNKHGKLIQMGNQRRSFPTLMNGVKEVRDGIIGDVYFAKSWYTNNRKPIGVGKKIQAPSTLDFNLWQGPAPRADYKDNLVHYNWHWFWHWGTGELGNNGVHFLDIARWALNVDYPKRVTSGGGRYFFSDDWEAPDTQSATFEFGDKMILWEHRSCQPHQIDGQGSSTSFFGDKGTIVCNRNGYKVLDKKDKVLSECDDPIDIDHDHMTNFVDSARKGRRPNADIEDGHKSTMLCHLGNIALRSGRTLNIDPKNGHILDDKVTEDAYWGREYRQDWEPSV
jgi:predicted dehydrogenase